MDIVPQADSAAIRAACAELSALHPWYAPRYRLAAIILLRGAWRLEHGALFVDGARYHPETGCSCQEAGFVECVHKIGHAILAAALVAAPHPTPPPLHGCPPFLAGCVRSRLAKPLTGKQQPDRLPPQE